MIKKLALFFLYIFSINAVMAVDLGNGVEYIPPSRKLGVGTKSPSEQLTVNGNFALKENSEPSQTSGYGKIFIKSNDKELYFRASDQSSVKITSNGVLAVSGVMSIDGLSDAVADSYSVFLGSGSGSAHSGNNSSTALGIDALKNNTSDALYNTSVGSESLKANNTGDNNTAIGFQALLSNTTGSNNTASGVWSLRYNTTGDNNTASGLNSLQLNTSGFSNSAFGVDSLRFNTVGNGNTATGSGALSSNSSGSRNTATGSLSLEYNSTGINNTAVGSSALRFLTNGSNNTALGNQSLYYAENGSANNTALGFQAGEGTASNEFSNGTFLGFQAGSTLTTGDNNILIGFKAGDNISSGATNLIIGYDNDAPSATASNQIDIADTIFGDSSTRNVGIGINNVSSKLTVNGDFSLRETSSSTASSGYGKIFINSADSELYFDADDASAIKITNNGSLASSGGNPGGSNKQLQYNNSGSFGGAGELYYNGQSLGINIAAPQDQLHVASSTGGSTFTHFSNSDTGSNSSDGAQIGINASENLELKNLENKDIIFSTNNTEQMRLNNSGNLGIGISNPSSFKLELNGGHLGPSKTNSVNLGSVTKRFNSVYAKENIYDTNGGIQWGTNKSKSFKTYYSSALVNASTAKTLTDMNGDNFSVTKTYKVTAHNPDVSSSTGAISYFIGNGNSGFTLIDAREEGTSSDHINLYLDSNTPKVKLHSGATLRNIQLLIEESPVYGADSNAFGALQDLISPKAGVVTIAGRGTNPFAQLRLITPDDTFYSETVYGNKNPSSGAGIEKWAVGSTGDNHPSGSNRFYIYQYNNKSDASVQRFRLLVSDNGNFHFNLMGSGVNDDNGKYVFNGVTAFKEEASTPSSSSGYGKIFVSSGDSELYFRADDQNAVRITNNGSLATLGGATNIDGLSDGKASGQSVFLGELSGNKNTSGEENTALGYLSLSENTTSSYNTAVGKAAMYNFISGNNNTAVGHQAMWMSSSGTWNTAIGSNSLGFNSGSYNTAIGIGSIGGSNQSGSNNTAVGIHTLLGNETGYENSALGQSALSSNTTGFRNSAMGYSSMSRNSSGFFNTASGYESLRGPMAGYSTGWYNTATGAQTLLSNTSGNGNTATGVSSLYFNTTGNKNTASGLGSLNFNTTGSNNTASGNRSLYSNTTGSNNTASGNNSLYSNTTGVLNSAFGTSALYFADNGSSNNTAVGYKAGEGTASNEFSNGTFLGFETGSSITTGDNNILIGFKAGDNITSGATNLIIGYDNDAPSATANNQIDIADTIFGDSSTRNVGIGINNVSSKLTVNGDLALRETSSSTAPSGYGKIFINSADSELYFDADDHTAVKITNNGSLASTGATNIDGLSDAKADSYSLFLGSGAGDSNAGFNYITAVGIDALKSNTHDSEYNSAFGYQALKNNRGGDWNTATGYSALLSNTLGSNNTSSGFRSLDSVTTGSGNTAVGSIALRFADNGSSYNTAIGFYAGEGTASYEFSNGTFLGYETGSSLTNGDNNIFVGFKAGSNVTSGSTNLIIGYDNDAPSATASNQLDIGDLIYGDLSGKRLGVGISSIKTGVELDVNGDLMVRKVFGFNGEVANTSSASITVDWTKGNRQSLTLSNTGVTVNFTDPPLDSSLVLVITQDATGSRTISIWDTDIKWPNGTAPTLTTTANAIDMISCLYRSNPKMYLCTPSLKFQ